uniref:Phospholipid:diacylglycerol acyltransferase n=1 Tax=Peronospora matthiolae TaxID=2874970 RepID=A0AAV1TYF5_9STRA
MQTMLVTLLQHLLGTLALSSATDWTPKAAQVERTRPVLLIPGFASSQLQSWSQYRCTSGFSSNLYREIEFGDRLWVDLARVLAQTECWIRCLKLELPTQDELECKLRAVQGLEAISELDPGVVTGPLSTVWRSLIHDLVDHFELDPDQLIVATYDWRLPPSKLQERDKYFYSLKKKIEYAVELDGNKGGVVVIAHSMGNGVFRYFLEWLNDEVGRNNRQSWIDRHISAYFAVGSPLLGSAESLELISSGLTEGLPITQSEIRKLVVSFGSILSFMPISSGLNSAKDNEVLIAVRSLLPGNNQTQLRNYTSADIASGQLFRDMSAHDPIFGKLETMRQKFYADDPVLDFFKPWERPPIASVYSVYGVNVPTKNFYEYENANTPGHWYQVEYMNEEGHNLTCTKTGDGTVTYHSLSWAHSWLGSKGSSVRVTQTPQSVYFSADNITRVRAVRHAKTHHAEYSLLHGNLPICEGNIESSSSSSFFAGLFGPVNRDRITFFESSTHEDGAATSTGVWEIDGVKHRDILSSPVFLRELRAELRHIFNGKTNSDKSSRPPVIDGDCYWNYRYARCEFPVFCEYRYVFGDVTFDQSCRVRLNDGLLGPAHPTPYFGVSASTSRPDPVELSFTGPYCSAPCLLPMSTSSSMAMTLLSNVSRFGPLQRDPLQTRTCDEGST